MADMLGPASIVSEAGRYVCFGRHHASGNQYGWGRATGRKGPRGGFRGKAGEAKIVYSNDATFPPGTQCRIQECTFWPCLAKFTDPKFPIDLHLMPIDRPAELPAVADVLPPLAEPPPAGPPPDEPVVLPAVADVLSPLAELPLAEPPPVVDPDFALQSEDPVAVPLDVNRDDLWELPGTPTLCALESLRAPAPATPIDLPSGDGVVASAAALAAIAGRADAVRHTIRSRLLTLARDIRKPRGFVGYSAFVLMGLVHKCRPRVREGNNEIDLISVFAPFACEDCTRQLNVAAIPCTRVSRDGGYHGNVLICGWPSAAFPL